MVRLKSPEEICKIEIAAKIVAEVLAEMESYAVEGASALDMEKAAEELIHKRGGIPAFKGYSGYPYTLCVSVNEEVIHGFPLKEKIFADGDIVSVDCGVNKDGFIGDAAKSFVVGDFRSEKDRLLLQRTEEALLKGIEMAVAGNRVGDIGYAVQNCVESAGLSVIRDYVGHGVGLSLHEDPQVPNYGRQGSGMLLRTGMTLAIEPMVASGHYSLEILKDGWTAITADRSRAAHFEHDIAILEDGPKILSSL
ncbi:MULTISPECIES: type I methionyl aminopeptidase [Mesotoga]|jgi:methionyl aminopeptidase|uniref:type I methionyl aminopeptidase n=1 Tax=Mesotoga TaxID=1184396 RepID=UPI0002CAC269|nr:MULTISPECIES: type I methionyl aminopeptidase [Mesotoga]MCP5456946.1 type I methionyl aminopeptidase [Thermotogota bacterium]CCU85957.1 Methionine aminopeptidase [Mesotoga infera]MCB1222562.1 type I methionyl aminopeptidase [Mesotoga sp.]MCP5461366.1 type I methionyl aminopeptidase [Thermotogota bacterium]MDK2943514.1 methionyl aminopeptidase [Mesotoga sp.]